MLLQFNPKIFRYFYIDPKTLYYFQIDPETFSYLQIDPKFFNYLQINPKTFQFSYGDASELHGSKTTEVQKAEVSVRSSKGGSFGGTKLNGTNF